MIECQKLELVDRRWDALLNGEKLDTIRFNEARIEPGFLVYENCDKRDKHCVVYVTAVRDIKLSDVLKYTKDKHANQMKKHF